MNSRFATRSVNTAFAIVLCFVAGGISAGDTGYGDGALFRDIRNRRGRPDIAIIPIGAYEPRWFMSDQHAAPEESVRIFQDVGARQAVGRHWGTFQLTNEDRNEPRDLLRDSLVSAGIDVTRFLALEPGEFFSDSAATASHT